MPSFRRGRTVQFGRNARVPARRWSGRSTDSLARPAQSIRGRLLPRESGPPDPAGVGACWRNIQNPGIQANLRRPPPGRGRRIRQAGADAAGHALQTAPQQEPIATGRANERRPPFSDCRRRSRLRSSPPGGGRGDRSTPPPPRTRLDREYPHSPDTASDDSHSAIGRQPPRSYGYVPDGPHAHPPEGFPQFAHRKASLRVRARPMVLLGGASLESVRSSPKAATRIAIRHAKERPQDAIGSASEGLRESDRPIDDIDKKPVRAPNADSNAATLPIAPALTLSKPVWPKLNDTANWANRGSSEPNSTCKPRPSPATPPEPSSRALQGPRLNEQVCRARIARERPHRASPARV